jgi:hypothetical protein
VSKVKEPRRHANNMKILILDLRDTVHGRRIDEIKNKMPVAEGILNNIV